MLLWLIFVISTILIYMWIVKPLSVWRERGVIHKTPWPIVGNLARNFLRLTSMPENVNEFYTDFKNHRYFGFYQFLQPILVLKDLDLIKQVTIKEFDSFTDHNVFISEEINPLFGKNLFSLKGQRWREMRSTLSPAFTSSKMRNMFSLISDCADQFTEHFLQEASKDKTGAPVSVEMKDICTRFSNDVIATTAFGVKCDSLKEPENEFYIMGKDATNFTGFRAMKFFGYAISPFLMKLFQVKIFSDAVCNFFRNLVLTTMETREREGIIRPDMIHLLMEARKGHLKHEGKQDEEGAGFATVEESSMGKTDNTRTSELTDDEITAQVVLFFFAGFDSISGVMCHMANELAVNPDMQKRLQDEIDETYKECNGKITYEATLKMKYLDMVLSETLRKWPAGIFTDRVCNRSFAIEPVEPHEKVIELVKGDIIWLPIFCIHRDPENFPNPEKFDPERFSDENKDNIKPFSYISFGSGPRNCIGSRFALLEAKVVFVHLLRKFNLEVTEKTQVPIKINRTTFNLNAEKGFWLGLKPRTVKKML